MRGKAEARGVEPGFRLVYDIADAPGRVNRGGSWYGTADYARAADRIRYYPGGRVDILGLRLCRDDSCPDTKQSPRSDNAEQG